MRIGERYDGIVCAFGQPLLCRYFIVRGRLGSVDMELRRFQRRHHSELFCVTHYANPNAESDFNSDTRPCRRELRHAIGWQGYFL